MRANCQDSSGPSQRLLLITHICRPSRARHDPNSIDNPAHFRIGLPRADQVKQTMSSERLHKLLAQHGLGSRRELEKWMLEGRVLLNGRPAQPGDRYNPGDRVSIDGKDVSSRLKIFAAPKVILYHKPQGQPITPNDVGEEGEVPSKSVMESLPSLRGSRWLVVNTMQAGDSGLMLLTSDGRLADALRRRAESTPA